MLVRSRRGRLFRLSLAGLMLVMASACGDDDGGGDDEGAPATTAGGAGEAPSTTDDAGSDFESVVSAAEDEGTVLLYTVLFESDLALLEPAFEEAHPGIDFQFFRGNTGEVISRLQSEQQSGNLTADLVMVNLDADPSTLATMDEEGLLTAPSGPSFSEEEVQLTITDNRWAVYATLFGWAWNTDLVPDGIDDWSDFLAPELSGRVAVFDPTQSSIIPACYAAQIEAAGATWLEDLAAQEPSIHPGGAAQEAAVASGEAAATMFGSKRVLTLAQEQGAPVDFAVPPQGACVPVVEGGILADAPHPNAAQVFANWIMTEEAQALFLTTGFPTRSGVPGSDVDFAELEPTIPVGPEEHQAFIAEFDSLFR